MSKFRYQYPNEKLMVAIDVMATTEGSLRDRIHSGWMSFHTLQAKDFDGELKSKFVELHDALTAAGPVMSGEDVAVGSVQNTLTHASDEEVRRIADMIASLYFGVAREHYGAMGTI